MLELSVLQTPDFSSNAKVRDIYEKKKNNLREKFGVKEKKLLLALADLAA